MKQTVSKINKLSNESLAIYSIRMIDTATRSAIDELISSTEFQTLEEVNNRYQLSVSNASKQLTNKSIADCYESRQQQFIAMYSYVQGLMNSPETDMQTAATSVFGALNMYGRYFGNYKIAEQSLRFIRIVEALKKPELAAAITKTKLTEMVMQLDTLQRSYEDLYMGRGNDALGIVSASNLRKELESALKLVFNEVSRMVRKLPQSDWATLNLQLLARLDEMTVSAGNKAAANATKLSAPEIANSADTTHQSA